MAQGQAVLGGVDRLVGDRLKQNLLIPEGGIAERDRVDVVTVGGVGVAFAAVTDPSLHASAIDGVDPLRKGGFSEGWAGEPQRAERGESKAFDGHCRVLKGNGAEAPGHRSARGLWCSAQQVHGGRAVLELKLKQQLVGRGDAEAAAERNAVEVDGGHGMAMQGTKLRPPAWPGAWCSAVDGDDEAAPGGAAGEAVVEAAMG